MTMKRLILSVMVLGLAAPAAFAKDAPDQKFADKAARSGMAEVEMANLAAQKASSDAVKQYAQHLQQAHQQANQELKTIAGQKNIDLPDQVDRMHKKEQDKLAKLDGQKFDRQFIDLMIKDHKDALDLFQKEADKGKDADLRAFAVKTEPELKQHLQQARAIRSELNTSGSTGSRGKAGANAK
jgi:putative membrane protein